MHAWETAAGAATAVVAVERTAACCVAVRAATAEVDHPATCAKEHNPELCFVQGAYHSAAFLETYPVADPGLGDDDASDWAWGYAAEP